MVSQFWMLDQSEIKVSVGLVSYEGCRENLVHACILVVCWQSLEFLGLQHHHDHSL